MTMTISNAFIRQYFSYKRPDGSPTEQQWIDTYIIPRLRGKHWVDGGGNIHYDGRIDSTNRTLFVGHTDTVHHEAGKQTVAIGKDGMVRVADPKQTTCLGADDGAGVLVLLAMIEIGVPAYYIFTRCEERGGKGAKYLHKTHSSLLMQFDRAVAFDRRGSSSVITHQGWGRCCSDAFADALSDALTDDVLMYAPDDGGVYTDTAEFFDIIPECTNISVGYMNEHTTNETLDLNHLRALIMRVIGIDWDALPTERDPAVDEYGDDYMALGMYKGLQAPTMTYSDLNMDAYDACEQALGGHTDLLMWRICEALDPDEPDSWYYEQLWGMPISESLIRNCMRAVDHAMDDEQTIQALLDLHDAMFDQPQYH
jgi:hypothetical protein